MYSNTHELFPRQHSILNVVLDCIIPKRRSLMMAFMIFRCVNLLWKFSIIFQRVIASAMVVVIVLHVNCGVNLRWYYFMIFQSVSVCWRISWSQWDASAWGSSSLYHYITTSTVHVNVSMFMIFWCVNTCTCISREFHSTSTSYVHDIQIWNYHRSRMTSFFLITMPHVMLSLVLISYSNTVLS